MQRSAERWVKGKEGKRTTSAMGWEGAGVEQEVWAEFDVKVTKRELRCEVLCGSVSFGGDRTS